MTQKKQRKIREGRDEDVDVKPQSDFYEALDILKFFDSQPARLIDYLETAIERGIVVPTFHAMQLSRKIGMAFVWKGTPLSDEEMLEHNHIAPANFQNIGAMLAMARMKFPRPSF